MTPLPPRLAAQRIGKCAHVLAMRFTPGEDDPLPSATNKQLVNQILLDTASLLDEANA